MDFVFDFLCLQESGGEDKEVLVDEFFLQVFFIELVLEVIVVDEVVGSNEENKV